jgi:hypothetical protein
MSRYKSESRRDPFLIKYDRHSELSTLHEAKLAAWAFAVGGSILCYASTPQRMHRGLLPDALPDEPPTPPRRERPSVIKRLAALIERLFGSAAAPAAGATAQAAEPAVGESATIAYIDRKDAEAAAAKAAGDTQPIRSRAA